MTKKEFLSEKMCFFAGSEKIKNIVNFRTRVIDKRNGKVLDVFHHPHFEDDYLGAEPEIQYRIENEARKELFNQIIVAFKLSPNAMNEINEYHSFNRIN